MFPRNRKAFIANNFEIFANRKAKESSLKSYQELGTG